MGYWAEPPRGRKNQVQYYAETAAEAPFTGKFLNNKRLFFSLLFPVACNVVYVKPFI